MHNLIKDQIDRNIPIEAVPKRIVSLVPSQTELLCDLGLEDSLVGITKFCVHPTKIRKSKIILGGTKTVHLDRIKTLKPDIVLCNKEENTREIVEQCEKICTVHVSDVFTLKDSFDLINQYGAIFNIKVNAKSLINRIQMEHQQFELFMRNKSTLKVVYFIWRDPWMVASANTFINEMLQINKFDNVFGYLERYPEIDLKSDKNLKDVDLIMLSSEPFPFKEKHKKELQNYFPKARIVLVDGEMFSWYGSRLEKAFNYFKTLH